jgi:hypothetical protein
LDEVSQIAAFYRMEIYAFPFFAVLFILRLSVELFKGIKHYDIALIVNTLAKERCSP